MKIIAESQRISIDANQTPQYASNYFNTSKPSGVESKSTTVQSKVELAQKLAMKAYAANNKNQIDYASTKSYFGVGSKQRNVESETK